MESQRYMAGLGRIKSGDTYEMMDIEPGEYVLEIPRLPEDPTDLEAYSTMDRTPHFRKEIKVLDKDVELDIKID